MNTTGKDYWNQRYQEENTPWDIGYASTPLTTYFEQLKHKELKILLPGAGNGYEAIELFSKGFTNTRVIDLAPLAVDNLRKKIAKEFHSHVILGDFFDHDDTYDLIVEQTFFCALHPSQRRSYVKKMHDLLQPEGKLMGLLFNDPLNSDHPPYGGDEKEYRQLFSPFFEIQIMESCHNSIPPRAGREIFILLKKKVL